MTVWVRASEADRRVYHTDENCPNVRRMTEPVAAELPDLDDELEECRECAGTVGIDSDAQGYKYNSALLQADPDVVGGSS